MSLTGWVKGVVEDEIRLFCNYQSIITKTASESTSGVSYGTLKSFDSSTGLCTFEGDDGTITTGVLPTGVVAGPNVKGYLMGTSFING